jgi:hypothetical protein
MNKFQWETHYKQLFPGEPKGTFFIARIFMRAFFPRT